MPKPLYEQTDSEIATYVPRKWHTTMDYKSFNKCITTQHWQYIHILLSLNITSSHWQVPLGEEY